MDINITVEELKERMNQGEKLVVIDVREPYEYEEFNIGGQLIPLGDLPSRLADLEEHSDEEIVVYCRSGARSAAARDFMTKNGFTKVRNLSGGILQWIARFGI